jgi:arylsulfatase A-like enzyme
MPRNKWGSPETFPHMAAGWAVAGNTPFMWTKQVAANFGGTRNPLVVTWPNRIKAKGEVRSQFHHTNVAIDTSGHTDADRLDSSQRQVTFVRRITDALGHAFDDRQGAPLEFGAEFGLADQPEGF